ncbi:MAG: sporulation protein YqfC [Firmicutes bacterium]|nr:sporulation protein YqfC [Bacillota bacterium]
MIKEKRGRLLASLASTFELPADVVLDLPRTTLTGNSHLLIENHKGILAYEAEQIRVRTELGETIVTGRRLRIDSLFAAEIVITGLIDGIQFLKRGE